MAAQSSPAWSGAQAGDSSASRRRRVIFTSCELPAEVMGVASARSAQVCSRSLLFPICTEAPVEFLDDHWTGVSVLSASVAAPEEHWAGMRSAAFREEVPMKVLVVDDNALNRLIASSELRKLGFVEVSEAASGLAALARAASDRPDLVLLDVDMPGLDGPGTLERLRADPVTANIPVVFFTAGDTGRVRGLGAEAVVSKPAAPGCLAQVVVEVTVQAHRAVRRAAEGPSVGPSKKRVLVADDNEYWRDLFESTLARTFEVRTVADGRAAVRAMEDWLPDALLLDVSMPEMSGPAVASVVRRLTRTRPATPRIIGFSADEPSESQRATFDEFVLKPIRSHELVRRLVKLLGPSGPGRCSAGR